MSDAASIPSKPRWFSEPALVALDGSPLPESAVAGKVVLVVNVASRCGFTPQYQGLQALQSSLRDQGLVVLGVPCNQFGAQEPGTAEEIASFCSMTYGVDFPILEKQDVKGSTQSPLYAWLTGSAAGADSEVKWNFEKFLIGRDGKVLGRWRSNVAPDDPALLAAIKAAL